MPEPEETRPLYADIPASLHKALKDQAYEERRSAAAVIRDALEQYLANVDGEKKTKKVPA